MRAHNTHQGRRVTGTVAAPKVNDLLESPRQKNHKAQVPLRNYPDVTVSGGGLSSTMNSRKTLEDLKPLLVIQIRKEV